MGELTREPADGSDVDADPLADVPELDPCTLLADEEWSSWVAEVFQTSEMGQTTITLEDGDACGWIAPGDRVRVAIGAFAAAGEGGWLPDDVHAAAMPVAGLGEAAAWVPNWPVPLSSTLVVRSGPYDLVIEMSTLEADMEPVLLAAAQRFAAAAIGRLS